MPTNGYEELSPWPDISSPNPFLSSHFRVLDPPTKPIGTPVLNAFSIVTKWVYDQEGTGVMLFLPFAKSIVPDISESELGEILSRDIWNKQCIIRFETNKKVLMQALPIPNNHPGATEPEIIFNELYTGIQSEEKSSIRNERQLYLHIIKILHGYCHLLTSGLLTLLEVGQPRTSVPSRRPQTTICPGGGDIGSHFEEVVVGGRVVPNIFGKSVDPYALPLHLHRRPYDTLPFHEEWNSQTFLISTHYIKPFLETCTTWQKGSPLPNFSIPPEYLQLKLFKAPHSEEKTREKIYGVKKVRSAVGIREVDRLPKRRKCATSPHDDEPDDSEVGEGFDDEEDSFQDHLVFEGPPTPKLQAFLTRTGRKI